MQRQDNLDAGQCEAHEAQRIDAKSDEVVEVNDVGLERDYKLYQALLQHLPRLRIVKESIAWPGMKEPLMRAVSQSRYMTCRVQRCSGQRDPGNKVSFIRALGGKCPI